MTATAAARHRRWIHRALVGSVCAGTLLLAACTDAAPLHTNSTSAATPRPTSSNQSDPIDATALEHEVVAAGRIAPIALDPTHWKLVRGPFAHHCPDIGIQLQFEWDARGPGSTNIRHDTTVAARAYEKAGFVVGIQHHGATHTTLLAHSDARGDVQFDAQPHGTRVVATSPCVVGNPTAYASLPPEPPTPTS